MMDFTAPQRILRMIVGVIAGSLVGAAIYSVYRWWPAPAVNTTVARVATVAPTLAKTKKVTTAMHSIQTYAPEAKAHLKLPPAVIASNTQQVTGAATVEVSEHKQTVTSVVDTVTGETTTYVKDEPLPWIDLEHRGEARLDVGYKIDAKTLTPQRVARLSVTHDFLQVKAVHFGVAASIDTTGEAFAGAGISYRW